MIANPLQLTDSLLVDVRTYDIVDSILANSEDSPLCDLAAKTVSTGTAEILSDTASLEGMGAAIAIPVYIRGGVGSVVVLALAPMEVGSGVLEVWEPVGVYQEVKLRRGYFANLERFANVSSFVRFEKGSGLPGQSWAASQAVIHHDLPNHPGFLRSAGASAGLMETGIAIPVINGDVLIAVVTLISSAATPLAKGFEVWVAGDDGFMLDSSVYQVMPEESRLTKGTFLASGHGIPGFVAEQGGACVIDDPAHLNAGRKGSSGIGRAVAMPLYDSEAITSIAVLLF